MVESWSAHELYAAIPFPFPLCVLSTTSPRPRLLLLLLLQEYMKKHKYGNTETYDLWNAWSQVSGKDIEQVQR